MPPSREITKEIMRALSVLAMVFLVLVQAQPALQRGVSPAVSAYFNVQVDCGGGTHHGDALDHAPCHACRIDAAVLPPPPDQFEPACLAIVAVSYAAVAETSPVTRPPLRPTARGPPALA